MKPRPTSVSATARLIEAPKANVEPAIPSQNAATASGTEAPVAATSATPISRPTTVAARGSRTVIGSARGRAPSPGRLTRRGPT